MIEKLLSKEGHDEVYAGERIGCHSSRHWFKVAQLGALLARSSDTDPAVPLLFGFYHDCRRESDGYDPEHGLRVALLAQEHFEKGWLKISLEHMMQLAIACTHHDKGEITEDPVIGTCWDADRLDLPRVGIQTDARYMSTELGKEMCEIQLNFYSGVCDCG